ncbi:hypothetical protein PSE10C_43380 [Pseudomonas amygdali pv. eriobotryae]|nr:hypothetical protein PSE10C_43380 [Pseudomonas amygdali pv. eriobotryae]
MYFEFLISNINMVVVGGAIRKFFFGKYVFTNVEGRTAPGSDFRLDIINHISVDGVLNEFAVPIISKVEAIENAG